MITLLPLQSLARRHFSLRSSSSSTKTNCSSSSSPGMRRSGSSSICEKNLGGKSFVSPFFLFLRRFKVDSQSRITTSEHNISPTEKIRFHGSPRVIPFPAIFHFSLTPFFFFWKASRSVGGCSIRRGSKQRRKKREYSSSYECWEGGNQPFFITFPFPLFRSKASAYCIR